MVKIKKSARMKKRYLLFLGGDKKKIKEIILKYIGVLGWERSWGRFIQVKSGKTVLCVERKSVNSIKEAFEVSKEKIKIIKVSGTLKGLGVR